MRLFFFIGEQAKVFNQAANGLPNQSAPLLHYYSFMNAVKALLSSRNINFKQHHGDLLGVKIQPKLITYLI